MRKAVCVYGIIGILAVTLPTAGLAAQFLMPNQQGGQKVKEIVYDHAKFNEDRTYKIFATPGELIRVKIINTCPPDFDITVKKLVQAPPSPADVVVTCQLAEAKPIDILHEEKYGGYNVEMRLKTGVSQLPQVLFDNKTVTLQPVDIIINVESKAWDFEMSGAFTTSRLTDPKFGLKMQKDPQDTNPNATEKPFIVRDEDAEDEVRLGVGAFIHLFRPIRPRWAATFGLGINDNNRTTYFTGASYRFGDAGALTLGYNWGSINRLPAGTDTSRPVPADVLSKLESQVKGDWFFALSYKFLNPTGRLERPFQNVPASSGGTTGTGTGTSSGSGTGTGSSTGTGTGTSAGTGATGTGSATGTGTGTSAGTGSTPSLPTPPRLQSLTSTCNSVTLTWEVVPGVTSYRVLRGNSSCSDLQEIVSGLSGATFEDRFVLSGRQFHYAVRSDNGLQSNLSECRSVMVPACPNNP